MAFEDSGDTVQLGPVRMVEEMTINAGLGEVAVERDSPAAAVSEGCTNAGTEHAAAGSTQDPASGRRRNRGRPGASTCGSFSFQRGAFTRVTRQQRGPCPSLPLDFAQRI